MRLSRWINLGTPGTHAATPTGEQLLAEQSLALATTGGLAVSLALTVLWVALLIVFDRVLPWLAMAQAIAIGLAIQQLGRGLDWRFPALAAALTVLAAFSCNFVIALSVTANLSGAKIWQVLFGMNIEALKAFFFSTLNWVDVLYVTYGAALAAFFAKRRLTPDEDKVLRKELKANEL